MTLRGITPLDLRGTLVLLVRPARSAYGKANGGFALYLTTEYHAETLADDESTSPAEEMNAEYLPQSICLHDGVSLEDGNKLAKRYSDILGIKRFYSY